jgi:hypothetical protein
MKSARYIAPERGNDMPKGVGYPSTSPKTKSLLSKKPVKKKPEKGNK